MQTEIDRLVVGELSENQRAELFAWCDQDANRWRLCALAFIEAQTWKQGLAEWMKDSEATIPASGPDIDQPKCEMVALAPRTAGSRWGTWIAAAACILLAFFAGTLVRDHDRTLDPRPTDKEQVVVNPPEPLATTYVTVPVRTNLNPSVSSLLQIPVVESDIATRQAQREMPDYVRKQWERQGYQVAQTERFLKAKLPDGRDVVVPVSGLAVKYVGKPVY